MPRDIDDILHFRSDISPFLVHLTRPGLHVEPRDEGRTAGENLKRILKDGAVQPGVFADQVSDARFGYYTRDMDEDDKRRFFGAVCFTETPLNEVHCLLEIRGRSIDLSPYGLLFLKDSLAEAGVSPVFYMNNKARQADPVIRGLCRLIDRDPDTAEAVLPLIAVFGMQVTARGAEERDAEIDFRWEREWRYPASCGPLRFDDNMVFVGLCPHDEIDEFEALAPEGVEFIDPRRNMKWYATKLIRARQRLRMKHSVV